jgi:hypothetical protein
MYYALFILLSIILSMRPKLIAKIVVDVLASYLVHTAQAISFPGL